MTRPIEYCVEPGCLFTTASKVAIRAFYDDGVELTCVTKPKTSLCRYVGTDGWVQYRSGKMETSENLDTTIGPNDIQLPHSIPERTGNSYGQYLPNTCGTF